MVIQAQLDKEERYQINNLNLHLKQLEKEEPPNLKVSRRKEITKIRAENNEKERKEIIANINKTKSWFSEKENKIDKPLARLIKKKRDKTQISKIGNEKGEITRDVTEIQRIMLLLSRFSRVRLCATPQTAAYQALLSLGFSRQEHWSGSPFLSPMHESEK